MADRSAGLPGVLRPARTERETGLRRDYPVAPGLRPFVERYWSVHWDLTGRAPFRSEVLSDPAVNVSVESGTRPRFGSEMPAVLVHGVVTTRFRVDLEGVGAVTAVKFRPGGYRAFTGRPAAKGTVAPLTDAFGVPPRDLLDAVLAETEQDARAAVLDAVLAPLAGPPEPVYLELLGLIESMTVDRELTRVADVAAIAGVSVRSLQRLFAGYVGVSPKAVLARYRVQDAAAAIDAGEADDLAGLAASLGWFDQAHFSREFRAVVGSTPSDYLRRARTGD